MNDYLDPDHWVNGGDVDSRCMPVDIRQRDEAVQLLQEILDGTCMLQDWVSRAKKLIDEVAR